MRKLRSGKIGNRLTLVVAAVACAVLMGGCGSDTGGNQAEWSKNLESQKDGVVRQNMRAVQVAAEHYAADHGGSSYPVAIDDKFKTYLPGGIEGHTPAPVGPVDPFTGVNHFPLLGAIKSVSAVRFGGRFDIKPGQIEYTPLESGRGYAIVGGAHDGKALMDIYHPKEVLVLTNIAG